MMAVRSDVVLCDSQRGPGPGISLFVIILRGKLIPVYGVTREASAILHSSRDDDAIRDGSTLHQNRGLSAQNCKLPNTN